MFNSNKIKQNTFICFDKTFNRCRPLKTQTDRAFASQN